MLISKVQFLFQFLFPYKSGIMLPKLQGGSTACPTGEHTKEFVSNVKLHIWNP